jgi:uncharacterized protein with HEPN domain
MHPEQRDITYLWDMRQAAREITAFLSGVSFAEFELDKKLRYAVERELIVIGEAATHVSEKFREGHPEIPWMQIIGQRNVLAHEYGEILVERIWQTVTANLPKLVEDLEKLLPQE